MAVRRAEQIAAPMRTAAIGALVLHGFMAAAILTVRTAAPALPPMYKVNLVAAPAGDRAIGVVNPPVEVPEAPTPTRAERPEAAVPIATKRAPGRPTTAAATPTPPVASTKRPPRDAPAPAAGGGPEGGRGADVANVRTEGIEFPYPGYLNNIVRQVALRFDPGTDAPLRAEVMFMLQRDGTVSTLRFVVRSGNYQFDLEAQGAIEAAAAANAFGPLPEGFTDDVLPIVFSFDPRLVR